VPEKPTGTAARLAQLPTGQPSRQNVPVHLSRLQRRPPARHRRGRSPSIVHRATTPMVRRWDAGPPRRPRRPELRVGHTHTRNRDRGHGRNRSRDRLHHWRIAYRSAKEVDTHLQLLVAAGAVNRSQAKRATNLFDDVRAMTWRLVHPSH